MNTHKFKESIQIEGGFGPIQSGSLTKIDISPLTVFIGPQGTGKSLISQMLYFFQDTGYLFNKYRKSLHSEEALRRVIEGMRVGDLNNRPLANFLSTPTARLDYQCTPGDFAIRRYISINRDNKKIRALKPFTQEIERWYKELEDPTQSSLLYPPKAIFIPTERLYYSRFIYSDPAMLGHAALPITMREFARTMTQSLAIAQSWSTDMGSYPPEAAFIGQLAKEALGGEPKFTTAGRYAGRWQWHPTGGGTPIEIEMTSSGQMEAWPLVMLAQGLFGMSPNERPTFIHVEEPEAHLHPIAQMIMMKILAYLAKNNIRIIITTHSLDILYMLNNLTLAATKLQGKMIEGYPVPEIQLQPEDVGGYFFSNRGVTNIVENGQIDEGKLGEVLDTLQIQYNHLVTYGSLWK